MTPDEIRAQVVNCIGDLYDAPDAFKKEPHPITRPQVERAAARLLEALEQWFHCVLGANPVAQASPDCRAQPDLRAAVDAALREDPVNGKLLDNARGLPD